MILIKDMIEHITNSNWIEEVFAPEEVDQSLEAWNFLDNSLFPDFHVIKETHRLITENLLPKSSQGTFRDCWVSVGNYIAPAPSDVLNLMTKWVNVLVGSLDPKDHHIWFESIHPFVDGNGRIGRMLMWKHEIALGMEPTLIKYKDRGEYYKWFDIPHRNVKLWSSI